MVKNIQLIPYKYTNEHLVASYSNVLLAEKYGFIPPAHKADFGEIVDMILVDDTIHIIGKRFYECQDYIDPEEFKRLAFDFHKFQIEKSLEVL